MGLDSHYGKMSCTTENDHYRTETRMACCRYAAPCTNYLGHDSGRALPVSVSRPGAVGHADYNIPSWKSDRAAATADLARTLDTHPGLLAASGTASEAGGGRQRCPEAIRCHQRAHHGGSGTA